MFDLYRGVLMRRPRRGQAGFTMIEVMIVCAIIVILAAVVIPSWMKEGRKGKFDPEIRAMFSEIGIKEEQYKSENAGVYITAPTCPTSVSSSGVDFLAQACYTAPSAWSNMRMSPTDTKIRCTYTVTQGNALAASPGVTVPASPAGLTAPSNAATFVGPWYYIVAECDMDGQGGSAAAGTNTTFFTASWDTQIQKLNYGQ